MNIQEILDLKSFPEIIKVLMDDPIERDVDKWQEQYDGIHAMLNRLDK